MAVARLVPAGGLALLSGRFEAAENSAFAEARRSKPAAKEVIGRVNFSADKIGPGRRQELEWELASGMSCNFRMRDLDGFSARGTITSTHPDPRSLEMYKGEFRQFARYMQCAIMFTDTPADSK
jgi:hypothetical protein